MEKFKYLKRECLSKLPKSTGVYAFKKGREFLYIGKASNIRERVKNHFQKTSYRDGFFIDKVQKIGYIKTNSEIEALILEANLIKKYQPKFNVVWKDDKNYFFVGITKEDFPRVFWTHQKQVKSQKSKIKSQYVGPFVDGKALKQTLKTLRRVFPYRSCRKLQKKPCLWYQLGRCPAPCQIKTKEQKIKDKKLVRKIKEECQSNVKNLMLILGGKKNKVLKGLEKEMKKAAKKQEFERAAKIRDQILALEKTLLHAKVLSNSLPQQSSSFYVWQNTEEKLRKILNIKGKIERIEGYDISNIQGKQATGSMVTFIKGKPDKNFYRQFKIKIEGKPNDIAMLKELLKRRFKHLEWGLPDLILIDGGKAQLNIACQCLTSDVKHIGVVALAKKENKLYIKGKEKPLLLKNLPREIFNIFLQVRDEAHRFALSYHKKLRVKALFENS